MLHSTNTRLYNLIRCNPNILFKSEDICVKYGNTNTSMWIYREIEHTVYKLCATINDKCEDKKNRHGINQN